MKFLPIVVWCCDPSAAPEWSHFFSISTFYMLPLTILIHFQCFRVLLKVSPNPHLLSFLMVTFTHTCSWLLENNFIVIWRLWREVINNPKFNPWNPHFILMAWTFSMSPIWIFYYIFSLTCLIQSLPTVHFFPTYHHIYLHYYSFYWISLNSKCQETTITLTWPDMWSQANFSSVIFNYSPL